MSALVTLAAVAWAVYHAGIEKGRKRERRQGPPETSMVTRIREWRR